MIYLKYNGSFIALKNKTQNHAPFYIHMKSNEVPWCLMPHTLGVQTRVKGNSAHLKLLRAFVLQSNGVSRAAEGLLLLAEGGHDKQTPNTRNEIYIYM